jgi:arylmalonate decarboxylase
MYAEHPLTIGLIVPPAHGEVPTDGARLYPGVRFLARGLGLPEVSPRGYDRVVDAVVDHARALHEAGASAVSLMGTSLSFYRGPAFTDELRDAMQAATGVPCTTMSHAVVRALRALSIRRVAVATAYIDEVNALLVAYLASQGFETTAIRGLAITGVRAVGEVPPATLLALADAVFAEDSSADGVLVSCGGLHTLDVLAPLESRLGVPAVSSSPAGFRDVVMLAGGDPRADGFGRLFAAQGRAVA